MRSFAYFLGSRPVECQNVGAVLAPMSGITDLGMRRAAQKYGATLVVSEMIDSDFYTNGDAASRIKADGAGLACHVVQIAGCRPERLAEAARLAEAEGAAMIDINMGCPAKKVVGGYAGSALMRDLDHATRLVQSVVAAVDVPVSLKMRLGWDDASINAPELARRAESEGVVMIAVHGRTRCQFYNGRADWEAIRAVSRAVRIPVVANGDCESLSDAREMLERSGAAAVMIGRAAVGRPWLVGQIAQALISDGTDLTPIPSADRARVAVEHYETILSLYGVAQGVRHARKHLAGYATHAGVRPGSAAHMQLVTATDPRSVVAQLSGLFDDDRVERSGDSPASNLDLAA